jgi:hypothetical protein
MKHTEEAFLTQKKSKRCTLYSRLVLLHNRGFCNICVTKRSLCISVHSSKMCQFNDIKGTVSRDFRLLVFFMNQFPPSP